MHQIQVFLFRTFWNFFSPISLICSWLNPGMQNPWTWRASGTYLRSRESGASGSRAFSRALPPHWASKSPPYRPEGWGFPRLNFHSGYLLCLSLPGCWEPGKEGLDIFPEHWALPPPPPPQQPNKPQDTFRNSVQRPPPPVRLPWLPPPFLRDLSRSIHAKDLITNNYCSSGGFPGGSVTKNLPANAGDTGLTPGLGKSRGEGNGNPLQYVSLGSPMDRGAWWAAVCGVEESWIRCSHKTTTTFIGHSQPSWVRLATAIVMVIIIL